MEFRGGDSGRFFVRLIGQTVVKIYKSPKGKFMKKQKTFLYLSAIFMVIIQACNLPSAEPTVDPLEAAQLTITALAQTQESVPTETPQPTFTSLPTLSPTPEFTATS